MNFKYTPNTLKKIEQLLDTVNYEIRYEKGSFNSGFCLLDTKKIIVINKFLDIEGKINSLIELIPTLKIDLSLINEEDQIFYDQITQKVLTQ